MFLRFNGLILSSLVDFGIPFETESGLLSDDWDRFRAFWAEPRMPSRLKLGVRAAAAALSEFGDFSEFAPLGPAASWGEGMSTEKSRLGSGNCLAMVALVVMVAVAECGESPLDDGDMLGGTLYCAGCDSAAGFPKVRAARSRGGTDSLLSSSTATTCSSTAAAPTPTGDDSDAANSGNTGTRGSLSNSHYRAATNRPEKPVADCWTMSVGCGCCSQVGRMMVGEGKVGSFSGILGNGRWWIHISSQHGVSLCRDELGSPIRGGVGTSGHRMSPCTVQYQVAPRRHL